MGGQATLNRIGRRPRGRPIRSSFLLSLSLCLSSFSPSSLFADERADDGRRARAVAAERGGDGEGARGAGPAPGLPRAGGEGGRAEVPAGGDGEGGVQEEVF